MQKKLVHLMAGLLVCAMGTASAAQPPATGLGQSWPNAVDMSRHAHFHAYVFEIDGVKYVQVNDANGNVLAAVGTSSGQFITLPMGRYAAHVRTPHQPAKANPAEVPTSAPVIVYQDDTTQITATPLSSGAVQIMAMSVGCDPVQCSQRIL